MMWCLTLMILGGDSSGQRYLLFCAACACALIVYYEPSHGLCSSLLYPLILSGVLRSALVGMLR